MRRDFRWRRFGVGLAVATLGWLRLPTVEAQSAARGAVSTENATSTREALGVLGRGGSAADAAITAALVSGVTAPTSSGLGGGGFALVWDAKTKTSFLLDFRETAPKGLDPAPFEKRPFARERIGILVGVPGEGRGLFALHARAGKRPWAELVKRAEDRARRGFPVSPHLERMLAYAGNDLVKLPGFGGVYFPGGKPAVVGTMLTHPALADTLKRLGAEGPEALYSGTIADEWVALARAHGSSLTREDLADYRVKEREPLRLRYEGYDVLTMPLPSAGGMTIAELLRLFPADELRRLGHASPAYRHLIAEGLRGAVADRLRYLGDPDFQKVDVATLLSESRLAARRASIALDRTHALPRFGLEEHGTHHLVTSDRGGNVVSLTTTVNRLFGSKLYAEKSGVVLNDELDDFTALADVAPFGLTESPNRPRPGARPLSSMTPTIVLKDGAPVLALGGSGGPAIATNVTQVLLASLVFDHEPLVAVSADRIYIPTSNATVLVEKGTSEEHQDDLRRRGEIVGVMPFSGTAVQALRFDQGRVRGAADPRKSGEAAVE